MYTQQYNNILDVMTPEELNRHAIIQPPEKDIFVDNTSTTIQ